MNDGRRFALGPALAVCLLGALAGCGQTPAGGGSARETEPQESTGTVVAETRSGDGAVIDGLDQLTPDGPDYEVLKDLPVPETEPAPEYMKPGTEHEAVAKLQERLMELGFMDNDEPTDYYGEMTKMAVQTFQRQNDLPMDGIAGPSTMGAIMDPQARYYAVSKGEEGTDIRRIQERLYELGYLESEDLVTGSFGDRTEAAVLKLQEINGITQDGTVGRQTMNLLYSDTVQPNLLTFGEKSPVVLAAQERLNELGYMTSVPDGNYGNDTILAVKQFQSRNDLVVDGFLGPSTRMVLNGSDAVPNGIRLGDRNETVTRVQQLLNRYGYLSSSNITGYYGEVTEAAVRNFQKNNGLTADGSVGAQTMAKLTGSGARQSSSGSLSGGGVSGSASRLISIAKSKLGSRYVWGAKGPNTFDCSGFVYWCLNQAGVKQSYLTSYGWRNAGRYTKVTSFGKLRPGDVVVVSGHVGIVAENGTVVDASSGNGKVVHRSMSSWWRRNFICGWRIFG